MTRPRDLSLNRPGLAATTLVTEGPGAAFSAIFNPEALTPSEGRTLAERMGVDGFAGGVLNAVTDPVVLLSLATSFRFPIPRAIRWIKGAKGKWEAQNYLDLGRKFAGESKKMGESAPFMMKLRSLHSNFRGTPVPEAVDRIVTERINFLDEYVPRFGMAIQAWEKAAGRAFTMKDQVLLTAKLEGLDKTLPKGFSKLFQEFGAESVFKKLPNDKAFNTLVKDWRKIYDDMWDVAFKDESSLRAALEAMHRQQRAGVSRKQINAILGRTGPKGMPDPWKAPIEEIRAYFKKESNYVPHYPSRNMTDFMAQIESSIRETLMTAGAISGGTREGYTHFMKGEMLRQAMKSAYKRSGSMLPALDDLKLVEEYVDPKAMEAIQSKVREQADLIFHEGTVPAVTEYSMRAADAASTYTHAAASMNAWTIKGGGTRLFDALHQFESTGQHMRAKMLRDTYIPSLMGRMTYDQANRSQMWSLRMKHWYDWLDDKEGPAGYIPGPFRKAMQKMMLDSRGNPTFAPMNRTIASYLYTSALGVNPASAVRNLFQLSLTTGPVLGSKYTGIGIKNTMEKAGRYYGLRGKGVPHAEAFKSAFPEYVEAGIAGSPVFDETVGRSLSSAWDAFGDGKEGMFAGLKGGKRVVSKVQQALMTFFSTSEKAVRLVTWEGAMAKGLKDAAASAASQGIKMSKSEMAGAARRFARRAVEETQFVSGIANTPYALIDKSPLMRQFMHFPLRLTEFATETSWTIGAGMPGAKGITIPGLEWLYGAAERRGMNPGTFARMVLWSEMIGRLGYEALDVDLAPSLITGALPTPKGMGAFAPMSVLPPVASLVGAPLMDMAKGEGPFGSEFKKAAPLLVPGGIGISRGMGMVPGMQEAARTFGARSYVDYTSPTVDGRYPVMTNNGNLISYMTMGQIFLMGTGLAEGGSAFQTERELYRFLISNRDRIREMKQDYIRNVTNGDMQAAESVDAEFQQSLPGIGGMRDWISEKDFENEHTRRTVTRLEKLLDTLPPQVRPLYAQALQTALMASGNAEILGLNTPQGVTAAPTSRGRQQYRQTQPQQAQQDPYQLYMSPLQTQNMSQGQISFGPYTTGPISGFASFAR